MKIFIFENVEELTDRYHTEGGLVIVSKNIETALNLIKPCESIHLTEEDIKRVISYELSDENVEETFYIFEDAGCC